MKFLLCMVLGLCVLQSTIVKSGAIVDKIKSRYYQVKHGVSCGLHKVRNALVMHHHQSDPCNTIEETGNHDDEDDQSATTFEIDIRGKEKDSTESSLSSTTGQGRRIIAAGSNCAPGYRSDRYGNCREEY